MTGATPWPMAGPRDQGRHAAPAPPQRARRSRKEASRNHSPLRGDGGRVSSQMRPPGGRSTGRPSPPPPRDRTSAPTASARRKGEHRRRGESREGVPQAAAWNESREAAARHPPPPRPPAGLPAAGAPAPTPRG